MFVCVKKEQSFDGCESPKGYPLRFDFFMPEHKLLIEADGDQHKEGANGNTPYMVECDNIKNVFAAHSEFILVRIPYVKRVTRDHVVSFLTTAGVRIPSP